MALTLLVTGGTRSGKSNFAEERAKDFGQQLGKRLVYIATAEAFDEEMAARGCIVHSFDPSMRLPDGRVQKQRRMLAPDSTVPLPDVFPIPQMRDAQMGASDLPNIGWATNADHGFGCNIHPPAKRYVGERLANSALGVLYGRSEVQWRSPTYLSASVERVVSPISTIATSCPREKPSGSALSRTISSSLSSPLRMISRCFSPSGYVRRPTCSKQMLPGGT